MCKRRIDDALCHLHSFRFRRNRVDSWDFALSRYDLEAIEEQFGPIIKGIVEDRLLLERIPEPPSAESQRVIRQVKNLVLQGFRRTTMCSGKDRGYPVAR